MSKYISYDTLISLFIVLFIIYITFIKELRTYKDYVFRSFGYRMMFRKNDAIEILIKGSKSNELCQSEIYGLYIIISELYYSKKDYINAIIFFEEAMDIIKNEEFCFDDYYSKIIKCYALQSQSNKGAKLYIDLLSRSSFDPKFKKLKKVEKYIK